MAQAFVVRTTEKGTGKPVEGVFDELVAGKARIGWSWCDDLDLRKIQDKWGRNLSEDQRKAKKCLGFLTRVHKDDYLLYPHQPERPKFAVVRVAGEYGYDDGLDSGDFRSFRPCVLLTETPVRWDDEIVEAALKGRLGSLSRFEEMSDIAPLLGFLDSLPQAGQPRDGTNRASVGRIHKRLRDGLPDMLRREFSRADLSRRLCADLFERMGYSYVVQEGPTEAGSDIVVTVGDTLLPDDGFRVGIQVFSYEGEVDEYRLTEKLNQLLDGWEDNSLKYGVLLTTARPAASAKAMLANHNKDNLARQVKLIDGDALADLFLKHFPPAEGGADSDR